MQLWLISLTGGEAEPLTYLPGGIRSFQWSPDGKSIAFIRTDTDTPAEDRDRKKAKNDQNLIDHDYKYDRLWIYDLASRQARLLTTGDLNIDTVEWSPDDATLISRVSPTPRLDDYWRVSKVLLFDAHTGADHSNAGRASPATPRPLFRTMACASPYSRFTPLQHHRRALRQNAIRRAPRSSSRSKLPGTIREMHWLGNGSASPRLPDRCHPLRAARRRHRELHRHPALRLSRLERILRRHARRPHFHLPGRHSHRSPPIPTPGTTTTPKLSRITNPQVANWNIGAQREISWKNPKDHRIVYGVVVLPPDYQQGTSYKTIVHIHGGPEEAWTVGFNGNCVQLRHHAGLPRLRRSCCPIRAVPKARARPSLKPTTRTGAAVTSPTSWRASTISSRKASADPDRLGIGGWSFGGFMTAWTVTHTDRFKAAMDGAGVTDLYSMATTTDISPSFSQSYMGPLASQRRHLRCALAGSLSSQTVHTPVLILHGEADPRVPISQGEEFYHGLRFLNKDAEMVRYPREPHIFHEPSHQIDSLTRILAWYDAHLQTS